MASILSAELAATCNALGYYDTKTNKYYADSNTLETVKDLIRYLRRDDETHDIRRKLGETKVLQTDLLPLLKSYWEEGQLFDVLLRLRLLVNLTTPPLILWNEEIPVDKLMRNYYLQIEDHLQCYKQAFADEGFWAILSTKLSKILEIEYSERGEENGLIIERIFILIRNVLYVPTDPNLEKRPDNDASIHDQVLWALHQSGMLDIILYVSSTTNEQIYYMHILEILSFMLREQKASDLASAALQRSETEKIRDEAELLAIRHRETNQKQQKMKIYNGARHSRFGGTYVLKSMKSISDNELIYHKPLNKLDALNFDVDKKKLKTPKNRLPIKSCEFERRSAFSIRLFLKEFCVEFLNGAYNTLMYYAKDNLVRAKAQAHDESYYLWALRFFMEFNRCYNFQMKLVSETMSVQTFHYVQQQSEIYFDMLQTDKKKLKLWSRRLHLALLAYRELLRTIFIMDKSHDQTVKDSANVIKTNIFYTVEYRELILTLLLTYDELKMSKTYLNDLIETQHIFIKMLEAFCGKEGSVVVQNRTKKHQTSNKKKKINTVKAPSKKNSDPNLNNLWNELSPQLSTVLEGHMELNSEIVPFDAASDITIDDQKINAMKKLQTHLRNSELDKAIGLMRASREVWPDNDCFGSDDMSVEEEFLSLREIFFADLGEDNNSNTVQQEEQPVFNENVEEVGEEDDDEDEDESEHRRVESELRVQDFIKRLANPKVIKACGLALKNFETNSINTNHSIIKLLHRISFDCKMYVMVFQVSIFRTFQKIYTLKDMPQYKELVKYSNYIIKQFLKVAENNKKVYMEALFWKSSKEACDIEEGYTQNNQQQKIQLTRAWSEEQEDELRRLFMEHKETNITEDVVDWILDNLIDNTRTRRGVLKKLKEMFLISNYKGPRKSGITTISSSRQLNEEEETQLQELFEQFKHVQNPIADIMNGWVGEKWSKNKIIEKLLQMDLIRDRKEVLSKKAVQRTKNNNRGRANNSSDDDNETNDNRTSSHTNSNNPSTSSHKPRRNTKNKSKGPRIQLLSNQELKKLLLNIVESGMVEALTWLKESLTDAIEDFQDADSNDEGIPLVPIMDYAVNAMEDKLFINCLKGLGLNEPFDEQEIYWRIPASLTIDLLQETSELITLAIENRLEIDDSHSQHINNNSDNNGQVVVGNDESSSSDEDDLFDKLKSYNTKSHSTLTAASNIDDLEENVLINGGQVEGNGNVDGDVSEQALTVTNNKRKSRRILDSSDSDNDSDIETVTSNGDGTRRQRLLSGSDSENPRPKRRKFVLSDDDDDDKD